MKKTIIYSLAIYVLAVFGLEYESTPKLVTDILLISIFLSIIVDGIEHELKNRNKSEEMKKKDKNIHLSILSDELKDHLRQKIHQELKVNHNIDSLSLPNDKLKDILKENYKSLSNHLILISDASSDILKEDKEQIINDILKGRVTYVVD